MLPETLGKKLPNTIEEAENIGNKAAEEETDWLDFMYNILIWYQIEALPNLYNFCSSILGVLFTNFEVQINNFYKKSILRFWGDFKVILLIEDKKKFVLQISGKKEKISKRD